MRFMMLMIPKGLREGPAGRYARRQGRSGDDEVQRIAAEGRRPAGIGWPATTVHGSARFFSGGKPQVTDGPFTETKGGCRWVLDDPGEVEGRGD